MREHKFRHNFNDTIDPFCLCRTHCLKTTEHFLLHCPIYASFRLYLFDNLRNNNMLVLPLNKSSIVQMFLYGSENYEQTDNDFIISCIIDFIIQSRRFVIRYLINPSLISGLIYCLFTSCYVSFLVLFVSSIY